MNKQAETLPTNTTAARGHAWDTVKIARHPERPLFLDYAQALFTELDFLSGDRLCFNDQAMLGALARFEGQPVMVIGQHKGRTTAERLKHRFGMPNPEGYRKSMRLALMAEKFNLPVITFIDTPGAFPGVEAEERGQAEAIAQSLAVFSRLKVPVLSVVIGEGGSGGALAIGVSDYLVMLSNSIYSVISPEGCASILWKTHEMAETAAEALGLTAERLLALGLIDEVLEEGEGAHVHPEPIYSQLRTVFSTQLNRLVGMDAATRCDLRYQKLMRYNSTLS